MNWVNESVFYHIYPLGFCGAPQQNSGGEPQNRIAKIIEWLPHLLKLHINAVYLGPVFESSEHGYDTADYYTLDRRLGTTRILKKFVKRSMRMVSALYLTASLTMSDAPSGHLKMCVKTARHPDIADGFIISTSAAAARWATPSGMRAGRGTLILLS